MRDDTGDNDRTGDRSGRERDPETREFPVEELVGTAGRIYAAFAGAVFLFGLLALLLPRLDPEIIDRPDIFNLLVGVAGTLTVVHVLLGTFLPASLFQSGGDDLENRVTAWFHWSLTRGFQFELIGFYGIVLAVLAMNGYWFLPFGILSLLLLWFCRPNGNRARRTIKELREVPARSG